MINFNGTIVSQDANILTQNRAFLYGDAVFETVKIINNKILFLEDHYFRLMSSMRVVRMEIPMNFTMEYFEEQILSLVKNNSLDDSARARITIYRNDGGYYLPQNNTISFLIHAIALEEKFYSIDQKEYEVDLYKDFYVTKQLLSSIKTTNKILNITASIYANENGLDNCILLNDSKNVVEALQGNIFMLLGNKLITPPVSEGCLNGVMRKQILGLAKKIANLEVVEQVISPFDLQKADELFITNVIKGIQPITKYRKKEFTTKLANELVEKLNEAVRVA
ncbi:aminotransferase class IV [Flavobacterium gawalongense]|uniref:branched-chain-amino-acid transaminase n=1 Tax=Flavobacterium gawalongense TaxID=2594432 RepID=A0A553BL04_9FLAO|nr:aminotransferase class IV [Flavobacterium gawalongense]TRX00438.1 aminotransferase class IV [Flavobacterium gawalongense]TRX05015.1 aminotransferase class IV [Flavobacterium gawalongense]TRX08933.1 aminotransferase class IV [Flavobacterium gawalongense]TRX10080.1 aminotransferase class IV [Flavobacterium gawalongense]TRX26887.1 aminotransferase class IV [Flavobacterium gawalongense]